MLYISVTIIDYAGGSLRRYMEGRPSYMREASTAVIIPSSSTIPLNCDIKRAADLAVISTIFNMKFLLDVSICMAVSPTDSYERDPNMLPSAEIRATTGQEKF